MNINKKTVVSFSNPYFEIEAIENATDYPINQRTIAINIGDSSAVIDNEKLLPKKSSIYANTLIQSAESIILITLNNQNLIENSFPFSKEIMSSWQHVYEIFPVEGLKETKLWRSEKQKIGSTELNLWYAEAGTHCGIHNEHDFKELHTQIYGIGSMQKFRQRDFATLYQDVYMSPGYTHEPFYNESGLYPWHQYYAHTDCIWMAIEF
jgi:hypothetical protein